MKYSPLLKYFKKNSGSRGFTFLETMVAMTIVTIITSTIVLKQSTWNDRVAVNNQAYDLSLIIRQAQLYSLGVRENVGGSGDTFNIGYGVYMDIDNNNQYILFSDNNRNTKYDSGEAKETITLTKGVTIDRICGKRTSDQSEYCFNGTGQLQKISVSFFRPSLQATLNFLTNGGGTVNGLTSPMTIYLRSPAGNKFPKVQVHDSGQVSITQ